MFEWTFFIGFCYGIRRRRRILYVGDAFQYWGGSLYYVDQLKMHKNSGVPIKEMEHFGNTTQHMELWNG